MINVDIMKDLIEKLNYYTKKYDEGHPEISDKQWDDMYFQLQELEKESGIILTNSPTNHIDYQIINSLTKVKHNHPMLSLQKTKDIKEVYQFLKGQDSIAMAKMDGLTCSLLYENGSLIRAETRGNGFIGEDITHNIYFTKGVPLHIPIQEQVIIDGEIICTYNDFSSFESIYKNPRNFASGSIRLLNSEESANRHLTFIAWDAISGIEKNTLTDKLIYLDQLGFNIVPSIPIIKEILSSTNELQHIINLIQETAKDFSYPIDGVVFKYDDCNYYQELGFTSHHAKGGIGFKFYDETYSTKLIYIDWTMGRTGQLTPVAVFEPVEIDGTIVERASLHNVSVMHEILGDCAYRGEGLEIYRANQIIPQIASAGPKYDYGYVISHGGVSVDTIEKCPCCGEDLSLRQDGIALNYFCDNPNCEGRLINRLEHFCSKKGLDIKGLSKATLEKLIDWGWITNFSSIYNLNSYKSEWINKPGFGAASVNKILKAIEDSKHTELWRLIAAIGIPEIGITASKTLANYYKTWDKFRTAVAEGTDFSHLPDFGYIMSKNINKYNHGNWDDVDNVANYMIMDAAAASNTKQILEGKVFCITGKVNQWKNRDSLKEYIESLGGKVTGSVTNKTDYLINNDNTSTTQKNVTAQKLNKPILTEENFVALIDDLLAN